MSTVSFSLLLALLTVLPGPQVMAASPAQAELPALRAENRRLAAEYALARKPDVYLVFDFAVGRVETRAAGLTLAGWQMTGWSAWGQPPRSDEPPTLVGKHSLFTPERETIVVGEPGARAPADDESEQKRGVRALELADMPSSYRLELSDGTRIAVRPAPTGPVSRLTGLLWRITWQLGRPFFSLWHWLRGSPYNEVLLHLPAEEAQRLYWAFGEGAGALVIWPLPSAD